MNYESNIYYNPEKWNMKLLGEIEFSNYDYNFDTRIFLQEIETQKIYTVRDSGCSCPTPFEDVNDMWDINEVTDTEFYRKEAINELRVNYSSTEISDALDLLRRIQRRINKQKEKDNDRTS